MGQIIKTFSDGAFLEYDSGNFDDWCVYLNDGTGRKPPRDVDYFEQMQALARSYGADKIYDDYVRIYDLTGNCVQNEVLAEISHIAQAYGADCLYIDKILSVLYLTMIAEERKKYTKLGKRIKRLGIHKLLKENCSVYNSANFMRNMNWQEISALCTARGF